MPSTRKRTTKAGTVFYEIRVSRGRGKSYLTKRWYPPEGWSKKAIDRELTAAAAEFERACHAGEIISRVEQQEREAQAALEAARISTLRQYGERVFMPELTVTMSENSRSCYQGYLNNTIYPALGGYKITEITPAQISALLLSLQKKGRAHSTVLKVYTILNSIFKKAYKSDLIDRNPMDKVERPKPRKDEVISTEPETYTEADVVALERALTHELLKWQAFVHILIDTGMRRGECCALQWGDVDSKKGTVTVSKNLCYTPDKGVYLDTPKNKKARRVFLSEQTLAILRRYRAEQSEKAISPYLFTKEHSPEPIHPQSPTRYLNKFYKRYGLPPLHPHKLRHTFASIAIANGADVASTSETIGHTDITTTLKYYTHATEESKRRTANTFQEAIKKAGQE